VSRQGEASAARRLWPRSPAVRIAVLALAAGAIILGAVAAVRLLASAAAPESGALPENGILVAADHEAGLTTWTLGEEEGQVIVPPPNPPEFDVLPRFSPDGTRIAFVRLAADGASATLMVVNADGADLHPLSATEPGIAAYDWAPSNGELAYTVNTDDGWALKAVGIVPGDRPRTLAEFKGFNSFHSTVLWHSGGAQIIVVPPNGTIRSVGVPDGEVTEVSRGGEGNPGGAALSPDGRLLAWVRSGRVRVLDLLTRVEERSEPGQLEHGLRFSSDGRWLATIRKIGTDEQVFIRSPRGTFDDGTAIGPAVEESLWYLFSPDGTTMIAGPQSDFSQAWSVDLETQELNEIVWLGSPPADWQPIRR
jgi:hypothetical protein